ncbi:MAG TPA: SusC/RagA family TonB-linked outer membrane protein [Paludibacter sp.]|nr:SusC/RagA family TonB-linked outer membrane protein [Paludibacter sp.]
MRKQTFLLACLMLIGIGLVNAQSRSVSGKVISVDDGQPVIGATVKVKGTSTGTITNASGEYKINIPGSANTLVVSYVGMKTLEVEAQNNQVIKLESDSRVIDEVVVTAIGIKRMEKSLGYAVSSVNPEEGRLKSQPDFLKTLQGRVSGVDIRSSQGTPGAATRINIRGNSSFYGSNEPLIIVDGVPLSNDQVTTSSQTSGGGAYSNGFSSLDPNDIASMSVLKGSAAAALYGSRASNGVIIIKTKSGSTISTKKKTEVSLSSSFSVENIANLPDYQNTYGAGSNYTYSNANGSWGPKFGTLDSIPLQNNTWYANYPTLFPSSKKVAYKAYPNNVKDLFRTGLVAENSLNFNGGNGKTSFNATLSNLTHKGYVQNSKYARNSVSIGGSSNLLNGLVIRGSVSYNNTDQLGSVFGENQVEGATSSFARTLFLARNWNIAGLPYETVNGLPISTNNSQYDNPLWALYHNTVKTKVDRAMANFGTEYQIMPWLNVSYQVGSNLYALGRREIIDIGSRALGGLGQLTADDYRSFELESNLLITLQKDFLDEKFSTKLVVGHNANQRSIYRTEIKGSTFNVPGIYTLGNTKSQSVIDDYTTLRRIVGVFADLTLGYNNYLFLNLTGRNDWSSTLPIRNRSYFYPAISASYIFSDALKIKNDFFSYGKIRAGWAKVGNDASPYSINDTYGILDPFQGQSRGRLGYTAHDPELKPEFTNELELGTQLEFFKRRLAMNLTWYNKISTSQIAELTVPPSSGYESYYTNFGKIRNRGIEIDLNGKLIESKDLNWDVQFSFTKNRNVVLELTESVDRIQLEGVLDDISPNLEPGMPFGYLRGSVNYRDANGNLLIDPSTGLLIPNPTPEMVGDPNPDFKVGLGTTMSYKNLFLSAHFDWTQGGDIYSVTLSSLLGRGVTKDTENREHVWVIPGYYGDPNSGQPILDSNGKEIPNTTPVATNDLYFGNSFAINSQTEWNIYDATVYRFRELTIGYELPKNLLKNTPFGSASISFSGYNLWYFAPNVPKYSNFDPEVNSFGSTTTQGFELSAAPTTRRYGINLKLNF